MFYTDTQRAPRVMKILILVVLAVVILVPTAIHVMLHVSGEDPGGPLWRILLATVCVPLILSILFGRSTLTVGIDDEGVSVRFRPFHRHPRRFAWDEIERIAVRKVSPLGEFGGWGIRYGWGRKTGYVWNGTEGIELVLRSGRTIVITVRDGEAVRAAFQEAGHPAGR